MLQSVFKNFPRLIELVRLQTADDFRFPVVFSIVLHLLLLLVFSISDWMFEDREVLVKPKELQYIKTVVVNNQGKVAEKKQQAAKKIEEDRIKQIRRKEQQAQQQKLEEQKRIAAKKARLEEEKKKEEAEKKRKEEEKKKALALEEQKKKEEAERKRRQALEKQKAEEKKRQEALLKQRQAREEQLRKMREAHQQQEALRERRAELEKQRQAALAEQDAPILSEYEGQIQAKISQNWSRPLSARNGMQVSLQIHLMPGGDVDNVKVIESSGDEAFDSSATQAVWKASPLPVPEDAGVFTRNYRVFNLLFSPEDLWE